MRKNSPNRPVDEYISAIKSTRYYEEGEWFPPIYLSQLLTAQGFPTTASRIARICNDMVDMGTMELWMEELSPTSRRSMYRKRLTGRKYLIQKWRKHTNEDMGVSQCCLFPA
jgi:hypothetical protein